MELITSVEFGRMINAAAQILTKNAQHINKLNVFPVPDGDTGTNMSLTMQSGAQYERDSTETSIAALSAAMSKGLLMGARGNSGVILSQIMRGFTKFVANFDTLDAKQFANALKAGAESAYKSVMKPTEGTILTVIRESAAAAGDAADQSDDLVDVAKATWDASKEALAKTPDLLPVLKEVGVVDSGGQGLVFVFQSWYEVLSGKTTQEDLSTPPDMAQFDEKTDEFDAQVSLDPKDIKYGYCTTILFETGKGSTYDREWNYDKFYSYLSKKGDSLLVIADDGLVKTHVHTEDPGAILTEATHYGSIKWVKIDNMRDQQQAVIDRVAKEQASQPKKPIETAVITVASGHGVSELFKSMGVTDVITGGQTMNPSTKDLLNAITSSKAKNAIIIPNNANIFMAASQAADMSKIPVEIVKSKTIQQGLTAMLGFNPDADVKENASEMTAQLSTVKSAEVTKAVRDTSIDGKSIKRGEYIGIVDGKIQANGRRLRDVAINSVKAMLDDDSEIVTIIYGSQSNQKESEQLTKVISKLDNNLETEIHEGDQPLYPFLISVE
ncbi:DAK2 domain-containing protein [Oenococcus oeni]|uniref:DAK2 domain-containing protein n=2 Tax=Oenococcus oeni TaxID=1247 RepID=UPI000277B3EA|nr:DAK2 domain-containing protein [Oenococcus oeni]AWW98412.1 DAK2 domain-containing protein [Oenococcus oeni]EJO01166.1 dihydroxyacetone kinase-like protein [Oenococcus oeni AWRIB419]EJO04307.1 dihydroxyacetone kinase-like protein [Oenococcus oeni AWRIB548]EJO05164.1 dihydroxyacetone kinase-like protein [Oenococcus oeni AWRIB422]EJO07365.1 dihydroxyacetone kinase-like protein [Oenococcus oeni AWRIB553]